MTIIDNLSWLVQPAETGLQAEVGPYGWLEQIIKLGIAALSLILLGLSISAYRRTSFRSMLYASVAFGLFAVQMVFEYLGDALGAGEPYNDIITPGITLAILVLFFMAIVRRGRTNQ